MDDAQFRMLERSQKGYYCSQILLTLALEAQGKRDPDLVRTMAGLARGSRSGSGSCGALTGGTCMIALYAGKGQDSETESEEFWPMLAELWGWFETDVGALYGGVRCEEILRDGTPPKQRCGSIIADTYSKAVQILVEHGIDPTEPRIG
jgi:Putative redox-active protein (C_GCAxxG_C_C)